MGLTRLQDGLTRHVWQIGVLERQRQALQSSCGNIISSPCDTGVQFEAYPSRISHGIYRLNKPRWALAVLDACL